MRQWVLIGVVVAAGLVAAGEGAAAADAPAAVIASADAVNIARKNACMGCHAVDRKLVGPSFQQIAEKYKGDAKAQARLEGKVRNGGSGTWGMLPMPSHPSMDAGDIRKVVSWILAGAPLK